MSESHALTDLLRDHFPPGGNLAILAGAGVSYDAPSSLPTAAPIMKTIVEAIAPDPGPVHTALSAACTPQGDAPFLRMERLLSLVYPDNSAPRAISVMAEAAAPNRSHLALARLGAQGAVILTTNFDLLIERACEQLGVPFQVAVEDDEYLELLQAPPDGTCWIVKLHGSADRLASVSATLEHVGRGRGGFSTWGPKGKAVRSALAVRDLVITGYSGSDDFDVVPLLLGSRTDRKLLWLDHCGDTPVGAAEAVRQGDGWGDISPKVRQVLSAMVSGERPARAADAASATRVHSRQALEALAGRSSAAGASGPDVAHRLLSALQRDCAERYAERPQQLLDAGILLEELAQHRLAGDCHEQGRELAVSVGDEVLEGRFLRHMAALAHTGGETPRALDLARRALQLAERGGDAAGVSAALTTLAHQLGAAGQRDEAIALLERAIDLDERLGREDWLAADRAALAVRLSEREPERARALHRRALDTARNRGDLRSELVFLNDAFLVAGLQANDEEVREMLTRALTLATALGDRRAEVQVLGNHGSQLAARGEWAQARASLQRAIGIADSIGFREGSAAWRSTLADLLRRLGQVREARRLLERALEDAEGLGHRTEIATASGRLGLLLMGEGEHDAALALLERALELDRAAGFEQGVVDDLQNLGLLRQSMERFGEAEELFEQAIGLARRLGYRAALARNLGNLGMERTRRGDHRSAATLDKEALQINLELENREGELHTRINLAEDYLNLQRHEQALAQALHARHLARQLRFDEVAGRADRFLSLYDLEGSGIADRVALGERLVHQGCPEEGLPLLERALRQAGTLEDRLAATLALVRVSATEGDREATRRLHERAVALAAETGNDELEAGVRITVGEKLRLSGRVRPAIAHFRKALGLLRASDNSELLGLAHGNLGNALRQVADLDASIRHTEEAMRVSAEGGDEGNLARWLGNRGLLYLQQDDPEKAVGVLLEGRSIQKRLHDRAGVARKDLNLGQAFRAAGRHEDAEAHLVRSVTAFRALGDRRGEAEARLELGWLLGADPERAARHFERARELLTGRHPHWPEELSAELRVLVGEMRRAHPAWAHVPDEVLAAKIVAAGEAGGGDAEISQLLAAAGGCLDRGALEEAERLLTRALTASRSRSDGRAESETTALWGRLWFLRGELGRAEGAFEAVLERLGGDDASRLSTQVRVDLANVLIQRGHTDRARRTFLALVERSDPGAGDRHLAPSLLGLGTLHWQAGEIGEAAHRFEQAADASRRTRDDKHLARALGNLGIVRLAQDRPREAIGLHEESAELCRRLGDHETLANQYGGLSAARAHLGELEAAFELRRKARAIYARLGLRTRVAESELALGSLWYERARDPGIPDEERGEAVARTAECSARALEWFESTGVPGEAWRAAVQLGLALRSLGDQDRACAAFRRAGALAHELDAPHLVAATRRLLASC